MKVLIIEDEKPAVDKLRKMLFRYDPDIEVVETISTVEQSVKWLNNNSGGIDLLFMDIMLTDGMSFEIFEKCDKRAPENL